MDTAYCQMCVILAVGGFLSPSEEVRLKFNHREEHRRAEMAWMNRVHDDSGETSREYIDRAMREQAATNARATTGASAVPNER